MFHALHTVDLGSNRLTRLSRGLGALMLYHELRHTDLADNPWEMPHPSVCEQVRLLQSVSDIDSRGARRANLPPSRALYVSQRMYVHVVGLKHRFQGTVETREIMLHPCLQPTVLLCVRTGAGRTADARVRWGAVAQQARRCGATLDTSPHRGVRLARHDVRLALRIAPGSLTQHMPHSTCHTAHARGATPAGLHRVAAAEHWEPP